MKPFADANMRGDRAAQVTGEQDRTEHRGLRNQIQNRARQFDGSQGGSRQSVRPTQVREAFDDVRRLRNFITPLMTNSSEGTTLSIQPAQNISLEAAR